MAEKQLRGRTAEIFRRDDKKVLKLFFPEYSRQEAEKEYKNAKIAYDTGCTPINVYEIVEQDGRFGFVMDFCPGISQNDMPTKNPAYLFKGGTDLARQHVLVHGKKSKDLTDIRDYTCDLLDNCEYLNFLTDEEKQRAKKYIKSLPEDDTIIHLDFHTGNVLVDENGTCRTIDWTTACRGNRAIEYGLMEFFFTKAELFAEASDLKNWFYDKVRRMIGKQYFKEYQRLMPLSEEEVKKYKLVSLIFRKKWNLKMEAEELNKQIRENIARVCD